MKYLFLLLMSFSLYAQGGGVSTGGGSGGPKPIDDTRTLLEFIRGRAPKPHIDALGGIGSGGGPTGPNPIGNDRLLDQSSVEQNRSRTISLGSRNVTVSDHEIQALSGQISTLEPKQDKEVLPTRLHIESINLSSDEVTEITLKDGSVVKVEDLQEFVRQKMKEKLNQ